MIRQTITRILARSTSFDDALPQILEAVGRAVCATIGRYWEISTPNSALLCALIWRDQHTPAGNDPLGPTNDPGLPGRACTTKSVICVNAEGAGELPGQPHAIAFPIGAPDVLGVMEFCGVQTRPDAGLIDTLADIGRELGQYLLRQQAEIALRANENGNGAMMVPASAAIICIDESGTITGWDRQAQLLFGVHKEKVIGSRLEETILPERYRADYRANLDRALKAGEGTLLNHPIQTTMRGANGREFPAEVVFAPIGTNNNKNIFIAFVRDIGNGARTSQTLREQLAEMEHLLSIVVHDLRRPLVSFYALLGAMKEEWVDKPDERANIEMLLSECKRMNEMLSLLTNISSIDQASIDREPVRLRRMLDGILKKFLHQIEEKQAEVHIECPDDEVTIARSCIEASVEQLLNNALKYGCTKPGCRISIHGSINGSQATIAVRDEGPGIALADQQRVFEIFKRLKNSRDVEGHGTGLTLVQRYMKSAGGSVALNSAVGAGAEFVLAFPL